MGIRSERGATIIFVAVAMFGLMAFAALAVDYGIFWVARGQAQTAADAAVLAAAQSMAFDGTKDFDHFKLVAQAAAKQNKVWGQAPSIEPADVTFPVCPPNPGLPPDPTCVRAFVYRDVAHGNPMPMLFGATWGGTSQGVRATATARAVAANATNCLKPWAVGDKWLDTQAGGWTQSATYDPAAGDSYTAPTATNAGTGFTDHDANGVPTYHGYQMVLKLATPGQGTNEIPINSGGWAMELALANDAVGGGNAEYIANITGCTTETVAIAPAGSTCTAVNPAIGCIGVKTGSGGNTNSNAIANFISTHDPSATWADGAGGDWKTGKITTTQSPSSRIQPVAIVDIPQYLAAGYNGGNGIVRVVNIVGFFIEGTCETVAFKEPYLDCPAHNEKSAIVGRLINYPAMAVSTGGSVTGSFGSVIVLVR